jgi:4-amino-4-deoxy-L-arabinose transferase-like glycosyltransferase
MRFRISPIAIAIAGSVLSWGILFALFPPPAQDFPLVDDWAFSHGAFRFSSDGQIDYGHWAAMPLLGQWLWAWPFIRILGAGHATLRLSVLVLSWIGLVAFADCLKSEGVSESRAALAAAVLAFNPMFYLLSGTFMSDVPALSFGLIALALYARAFRQDRLTLLLAATLVACAGVSTRQTCIMVPIAAGISMAINPAWRRRIFWWAPLILVPVILGFAVHWWFVNRHDAKPADPRRVTNLFLPFVILYLFFHFGGLAVLPIIPSRWRPASWLAFLFAGAAMAFGACCMVIEPGQPVYVGAESWFPYVAGIFTTAGAYASEPNTLFWGQRPVLFNDTARVVITVIGCVAGAWLAARLLKLLSDGYRPGMLIAFAVLQIPFILISPYMFDRYFLAAIPATLLVAVLPLPGTAWRWPPAIVATSLLALFSFSLMHDWLAWNAARWELGNAAMRKQIPWTAIGGGFEWDGWWNLEKPPLPHGDGRNYRLSFSPLENSQIVDTKSYTQWLPPGRRVFYLLEVP